MFITFKIAADKSSRKPHNVILSQGLRGFLMGVLVLFQTQATQGQRIAPRKNEQLPLNDTFLNKLIDKGIEPRKYVNVFYKRRPDAPPEKSLAIWRWDSLGQHQRYKVLDKEGVIHIYFDKDQLTKDTKFRGSISLSASVKSNSGERPIEVSPYSKVGEQQQTFGTNSISPELTAQLLFNAIYTIKSMLNSDNSKQLYQDSGFQLLDTSSIRIVLDEIARRKLSSAKFSMDSLTSSLYLRDLLIVNGNFPDARAIQESIEKKPNYNFSQLYADLTRLKESLKISYDYYRNRDLNDYKEKVETYSRGLNTIIAYLDAFETAGTDAKAVFLQLIGTDIIKYAELRQTLKNSQAKILTILNNWSANSKQVEDGIIPNITRTTDIALREISSFSGSEFDKALFLEYNNRKSTEKSSGDEEFDKLRVLRNSPNFSMVIRNLSITAAEYLYSLLTYATINLAKNDVKQGDVLYLYVQWKNFKDQMVDSLKRKDDEKMEIGYYRIEKTGWSTDVSESFYLIERINEPERTSDDRVSPSNFKGAAGVSVMRTFNYSEPNEGTPLRFLNWLQPSIGLNLSYVDFYTTKDLELGLGLQIGLFKNTIFIGYGVNLNGIRKTEYNASYFMLGLSFINLGEKFKDLKD